MATNPKEMAEIVRRLSAKNAPKDTVLAAITPKEAAILKARGGSGKVDPVTGVKHFEENDDNAGYNDDGSWNDSSKRDKSNGRSEATTGFGKMPGDSGSWSNNTGGAYGDLSGTQTAKRSGSYNEATGEYRSSSVTMGGWDRIRAIAAGLFGGLKSIGPLLSGNPVGVAYGAITGAKATTKLVNGIRGNTGLPGDDLKPTATTDSTRTGAGLVASKALTDSSTSLLGGTTKATPTFDYFQAIARSRQGQKSTVLGGGTGSAPSSTSLLGV